MMEDCAAKGYRRIALAGASDIAEIATLTAHDHDVVIAGVVDPGHSKATFCGLPVVKRLSELGRVDAVIVTGTDSIERVTDSLAEVLTEDRILVPELIQLSHIRKANKKDRRSSVPSGPI